MEQASAHTDPARRTFRVGDKVMFLFGITPLRGTIVEYRGKLGRGGRPLYRVEAPMTDAPSIALELAPEEMEHVE